MISSTLFTLEHSPATRSLVFHLQGRARRLGRLRCSGRGWSRRRAWDVRKSDGVPGAGFANGDGSTTRHQAQLRTAPAATLDNRAAARRIFAQRLAVFVVAIAAI